MMPKTGFATRIRLERLKKGLSQEQLGKECGRSTSWIVDVERAKTIPTRLHDVEMIAKALKQDPVELNAIRLESLHASQAGPVPGWSNAEQLDCSAAFLHLSEADFSRHMAPEKAVVAPPRSAQNLGNHAERTVSRVASDFVSQGRPIPITRILGSDPQGFMEAAEVNGRLKLEVETLAEEYEGQAVYEGDRYVIRIPARIWAEAELGYGRARFTMAHEACHVAIHSKLLREREMFRDQYVTATAQLPPHVRIYESPEWQANCWASAFLMPAAGLAAFLRTWSADDDGDVVRAIAQRFEVSYQAARIRLDKVLPTLVQQSPERNPAVV